MSTRALVTLFAIPLLALVACSREKSDWRSAQAADSPESYEQFIVGASATARWSQPRANACSSSPRKRIGALRRASTASEAYQQFLTQYPTGKWAKEAQVRIDNFAASAAVPGGRGELRRRRLPAKVQCFPMPRNRRRRRTAVTACSSVRSPRRNAPTRNGKSSQDDAAGMLDGLSPRVVVGESQGKTLYRLQAEVRDEAQARAICGGLKVAKKPCVPVIPRALTEARQLLTSRA